VGGGVLQVSVVVDVVRTTLGPVFFSETKTVVFDDVAAKISVGGSVWVPISNVGAGRLVWVEISRVGGVRE
jgi:hypothetical protein